jgi:hypothetical protein
MKLTILKPKVLAVLLTATLALAFAYSRSPLAKPMTVVSAAEHEDLDFDIVNRTGYDIKHVLIAPSRDDHWDINDDVLKGREFHDGTKLHITFSPHAHAAHWDIKVVYRIDGSSKEFTDLNLTKINKVTLWYDAKHDATRAEIQ